MPKLLSSSSVPALPSTATITLWMADALANRKATEVAALRSPACTLKNWTLLLSVASNVIMPDVETVAGTPSAASPQSAPDTDRSCCATADKFTWAKLFTLPTTSWPPLAKSGRSTMSADGGTTRSPQSILLPGMSTTGALPPTATEATDESHGVTRLPMTRRVAFTLPLAATRPWMLPSVRLSVN